MQQSYNQQLFHPILEEKQLQLFVKREDALHPIISGNKFRKLKYNILEAKSLGKQVVLSFGGAYSNHIVALAAAAAENNLHAIGLIRGEELAHIERNVSLQQAYDLGMQLKYISRSAYRHKTEPHFIRELQRHYGDFYLVPEGGTNELAVLGCEEILSPADRAFDFVCCAVGTGGTISGLIRTAAPHQKVLGFPALKGDFLQAEIQKWVGDNTQWKLISSYHFGGYAKVDISLIATINTLKETCNLPTDPIYTGKMMFGLLDLIKNDYFAKGSKILAIHTGGLQGIEGMNTVLKKKNLPCIQLD
ncbi:MAG: pyridoxal-phosphate dependent enzyme [Flavobacteriaceae bacterium]|nr:pyridoxal-phosphate dependent enzyme [Flavobacteriaceae bacterium]